MADISTLTPLTFLPAGSLITISVPDSVDPTLRRIQLATPLATLEGIGAYPATNPLGFITLASLTPYALSADLDSISSTVTVLSSTIGALSTVARSGLYADLVGIPAPVSQLNSFQGRGASSAVLVTEDVIGVLGDGLPIAQGGTAATSAPQALANLGAYPANNPAGFQTLAQLQAALAALVGGAPTGLTTLGALATQIAADEVTAASLATTVAGKATRASNLSDLPDKAAARGNLGLAAVASSGLYSDLSGAPPQFQGLTSFQGRSAAAASLITADVLGALSAGLPVAQGGTGAVTPEAALTVLGAYPALNPAGFQTAQQVASSVQAIVGAAPAALDTLGEIAAQLAADENAVGALTTTVGTKLAKSANLSDLADKALARASLGLAAVAVSAAFSDLVGIPNILNSFNGRSANAAVLTNADVLGVLAGGLPVGQGGTGSTTASGALSALGGYPAANPGDFQSGAQLTAALSPYLLATTAAATYQTAAQVAAALAAIVGNAPVGLATLGAIAAQIFADEAAVSALTTTVNGKLGKASNLGDLQNPNLARVNLGLSTVAASGLYADLIGTPAPIPALLSFQGRTAQAAALQTSDVLGVLVAGLPIAQGGTGATTPDGALVALGAYPASNPAGHQTAAQVATAIQTVVGAAPAALDTLAEIATQLQGDESAAAALTTTVAGKLSKAANLSDLTDKAAARTSLGLAAVAVSGAYSDLAGAPPIYVPTLATTSAAGISRPDGTTISILNGVISAVPQAVNSGVMTFQGRSASSATLLTADVLGVLGAGLPIAQGGTGATTPAAALTQLGAYPLVGNPSGYQTASQVLSAIAGGTAANVSGLIGLPQGGTGATSAAGALINLGAYAATNPSGYQTAAQVATTIQTIVGTAPAALDTLGEIAAQLASDENAAAALTTTVSGKLTRTNNLSDLASASVARTNLGLAPVASSGSYLDLTNRPAPRSCRTVTAAGNITVLAVDDVIAVRKASPAPTAVLLEASPALGACHTVKDARGDAATNNITITGANGATIDGQPNLVISVGYSAIPLIFNGSEWSVI